MLAVILGIIVLAGFLYATMREKPERTLAETPELSVTAVKAALPDPEKPVTPAEIVVAGVSIPVVPGETLQETEVRAEVRARAETEGVIVQPASGPSASYIEAKEVGGETAILAFHQEKAAVAAEIKAANPGMTLEEATLYAAAAMTGYNVYVSPTGHKYLG